MGVAAVSAAEGLPVAGELEGVAIAPQPKRMSWLAAWWFVLRYNLFERRAAERQFDDAAFARIEAAIDSGEKQHRGEIRFALEADLTVDDAQRFCAPRDRAMTAFALHGIWDTEYNSGVLIFLQLPLHAVEIVVDRGVCASIDDQLWQSAIDMIIAASKAGRPVDGIVDAIDQIHGALAVAMPAGPDDVDELPDRPIRL